jgi:DNA-binding transcriptional LysR family regulator
MPGYTFEFNPSLLDSFMAVAEAGSILKASKGLHLSQPAVSAQIQKLETAIGVSLFRRSVSGVELTEAGHKLFEHAQGVYTSLSMARSEVLGARAQSGHLSLFASTTLADHVVPRILVPFRSRYPGISVQLKVGNTEEVIQAVRQGQVPLGLVEGVSRAPSVRLETFMEDELVLTVSSKAKPRLDTLDDFGQQTLLWREQGSGTRDVVEKALMKLGLGRARLRSDLELGSTEAIKTAVAGGLGMAFLSRWSIQDELLLGTLKVVPFPGAQFKRTFHWVRSSGAMDRLSGLFYDFANKNKPHFSL